MDCRDVERKILDYWDGRLSESDRAGVEDHIGSCAACRLKLSNQQKTDELLAGASPIKASLEFESRLMNRIERFEEERLRKRKVFTVFFASASLAAAAILLVTNLISFDPAQVFKPDQGIDMKFEIAAFTGDVNKLSGGKSFPVSDGSFAAAGDTLVTGDGSGLELRVSENGVVRVSQNSRVTVSKSLEKRDGQEYKFTLEDGSMLCQVNKTGKYLKMDVATPDSTVTVHGTAFKVSLLGDARSTKVIVKEGVVSVTGAAGKKERVLVEAGNWASVMAGGTITRSEFGLAELNESEEFRSVGKGFDGQDDPEKEASEDKAGSSQKSGFVSWMNRERTTLKLKRFTDGAIYTLSVKPEMIKDISVGDKIEAWYEIESYKKTGKEKRIVYKLKKIER